jgi:DNA mismatch repair ATPase MutL
MTAYRNSLEAKRYPVAVLHLEVPFGTVDVNVHPAKREVRFQNPREIYGLVVESALHALSGQERAGEEKAVPVTLRPSHAVVYQARVEEALKRYHLRTGNAKLSFKNSPASISSPPPALAFRERTAIPETIPPQGKISFTDLTYLGRRRNLLVFSGPDGCSGGSHAAH